MKVITKTLLFGALSFALVACGTTTEEEDTNTTGDQNQEESGEVTEDTEAETTETTDATEGTLPVTILKLSDEEIVIEMDGEEIVVDTSTYTTTFDKQLNVLDGMTFEYEEKGQPTATAVYDEDHLLSNVLFVVEENLRYNGDELETRDIDVEWDKTLVTTPLEAASHVNNYEVYDLEDSPFAYYIVIDGDASKPGHWTDAIRGNDYRQYTFVEVTENGRYLVKIQLPADEDVEVEAIALALALSYQSNEVAEDTTDVEDEEEVEETEE